MQNSRNRIEWLAIMRGITILLVVMGHVQLIDLTTGENHAECIMIREPFAWMRMPVFIFSSGALLYLSRIRKNVSVTDLYKDKFLRICVPMLFFVNVYYIVKFLTSSLIKTPIDTSFSYYLESYYIFQNHSSAPLWFLAVLTVLMAMYPLFVWLCRSGWHSVIFWFMTIILYHIDFLSLLQLDHNYFHLFSINKYIVFFFSGIAFFRYKLYKYFDNVWLILPLAVLYAVFTHYDLGLLSSFAGISLLVSLSLFVAHLYGNLFSSFREDIYQIYLMSFFAQAFVELILWKKLFYNEDLFWLFYVLNVAAGIYVPVLITKVIQRIPVRMVRLCFGLK